MAGTLTTIRVDTTLVRNAMRALGVASPTEAVHIAIRTVIGSERFEKLTAGLVEKRAGQRIKKPKA